MSDISCSDVCEVVLARLGALGFKISDDPDHTDVLEALDKVTFVKDEGRIVIAVKTLITPEAFEKLEDKLKELLENERLEAVIDDLVTGNTTVTELR